MTSEKKLKNTLINYYALITLILFIIYNLILKSLKIGGSFYRIFMIGLIVLNARVLIKNRNRIKYKNLALLLYFFLVFFSKVVLNIKTD